MMGRQHMANLNFGIAFAGAKNWGGCIAKPVTDCAEPKPSAWQQALQHTVVTDNFSDSVPAEVINRMASI